MRCINNFTYHAPTALYFGAGTLLEHSDMVCSFGSKAFIITGKFAAGYTNYALSDCEKLLIQNGLKYYVYSDVEENPSVESIAAAGDVLRRYAPDFIIAIGGGSALDTAKAVNVLINYSENDDPYKVFYGDGWCINGRSSGKLPMIGIPTTAGSGSEVMGYAVLTRNDTHTKLRMDQLSFFDAAFLDPQYIKFSPQWLLDAGAMDALAHGVEGYLNTYRNEMACQLHELGFVMFSKYKDKLLNGGMTDEEYGYMLKAAAVQGMAVMQSGTSIPHGMGYPLTHEKNITHGLASAITLPAYLDVFKQRDRVDRLLEYCGYNSAKEFNEYIRAVIRRNIKFQVSEQEIHTWSCAVEALKVRVSRHPEPINSEMIADIYRKSLSEFIV